MSRRSTRARVLFAATIMELKVGTIRLGPTHPPLKPPAFSGMSQMIKLQAVMTSFVIVPRPRGGAHKGVDFGIVDLGLVALVAVEEGVPFDLTTGEENRGGVGGAVGTEVVP